MTARAISSASASSRGWTSDVLAIVDRLLNEFTLADIYAYERSLKELHPSNMNIKPKIRQQLQVARDMGLIAFRGQGRYAKRSDR
jgi:type II restriction enzyme